MKKTILMITGVIVIAYIVGLFSIQHVHNTIHIDASPEAVWNELVNFKQYPTWNPFIKKISGELSVGSTLAITVQPPGGDPMDFEPTLLVANKDKELRWRGRVFIPKLFDGEHYFLIQEKADGTVLFIQGENFSGILALVFFGSMEEGIKQGFIEMNKAIKARTEPK